jgi:predicted dehydrogenase
MNAVAMKPRLGFLGVGWIGRHRLDAIEASGAAEVAAVADPALDGELASLEELLEHELDAIVIATPSAQHAEQAIAALERGLPVFCQKPLGRTAAETARVVDAARAADRLLGVDFCYRHLEAVRRMHAHIPSDVYAAELTFHNAFGPDKAWFYDARLSGGGCVIDLGIHLVDLLLTLLGRPAVEVVASRLRTSGAVEDYAVAQLELDGRVVARLACSWRLPLGRDAEISARLFGSNEGVHLENVCGSFYDFRSYFVHGREVEVLAEPPDDWGGRAAVEWAERLARSPRFNPEVEQVVDVARVIDAIYGRTG